MFARFAAIRARVLLLSGSRSARDLRIGTDALARLLPNAERVVLAGMGHTAALDEGHPDRVAVHLRRFFY